MNGDINTTILLKCKNRGDPDPTITWFTPDNLEITEHSQNKKFRIFNHSFLEIKKLQEKDTGLYKCSARNEYTYKFSRRKFGIAKLNVVCK